MKAAVAWALGLGLLAGCASDGGSSATPGGGTSDTAAPVADSATTGGTPDTATTGGTSDSAGTTAGDTTATTPDGGTTGDGGTAAGDASSGDAAGGDDTSGSAGPGNATVPPGSPAGAIALLATDDAEVRAGKAKDDTVAEPIIYVKDFPDTPEDGWAFARGLLRFDLAPLLAAGLTPEDVLEARVALYGNVGDLGYPNAADAYPVTIDVWAVPDADDGWSEKTVTWNTQPARDGDTPIGEATFEHACGCWEYLGDGAWTASTDLIARVRQELGAGNRILSLRLEGRIQEEAVIFTKEHHLLSDVGPRLVLVLAP